MIDIKTLYYDIGNSVKGICDRVYPRSRPKSIDAKIDSYIVVCFPSAIYNREISNDGRYSDYTSTVQLEVYVRDTISSANPNGFNVAKVEKKVNQVLEKFPISTENILVINPRITLQADDGNGFSATIIQGRLRTK